MRKYWLLIGAVLLIALGGIVAKLTLGNESDKVSSQAAAVLPTETATAEAVPSTTLVSGGVGETALAAATQTPIPATPTSSLPPLLTAQEGQPLPSPTNTSIPTVAISSPPPATTSPCNQAAAGVPLDVTAPAGARFNPGEEFVKTWRIVNTGSCTWTPQYALVWVSGQQMSTISEFAWGSNVAPGEMLEISVLMTAPRTPGRYQSGWLLRSPNGERFGVGAGGGAELVVSIEVVASATPTATTGKISGRVVFNGAPAGGVNLTLEDRGTMTIAAVQTSQDGTFSLVDLPPYLDGYNLVFTQEANQQYAVDQVVSWAWVGWIPINAGDNVVLPDFEIGLAGLSLINPAPDSLYIASAISPGSPLLFEFSPYPGASSYWVDLSQGEQQAWVWQSPLTGSPPVVFEGRLFGGVPIQPGDYWWAVGAQKPLGAYTQTVYSYLVGFGVEP